MKNGMWVVLALGSLAAVGCSSDKGSVSLTWSIIVNGQNGDCNDVGAASLQVTSTRQTSGRTFIDVFDCEDFQGESAPLPTGVYDVQIDLLDDAGNILNLVDVIEPDVVVESGLTTSLGNFPFGFNVGKVSFRVHMGSAAVTGGNCAATNPNNGAGVSQEEIRVTSATQCMAFPLTGVGQNAQTCQRIVCQETNVNHQLEGLSPGRYDIQVLGYKGATSATPVVCYLSQVMSFNYSGSDIDLGQIFAPFDDSDNPTVCNATKPV